MDRDTDRFEGRMHGPQFDPDRRDSLWQRLIYMVLIWVMVQVALTVLGAATIVQFIFIATSKGTPNERLAEFGESLGIWVAKAARYLTAASEVKPWPWTELD